jgi:hypothetical protein
MAIQKHLLLVLAFFSSSASAFPEIPFCPIGGPPGWFNRMTGEYQQYRYPPVPPPLPYFQSYPVPAYPAYQSTVPPTGLPENRIINSVSPR